MAANIEQLTVSVTQVLSVVTPIVMLLLGYIWKGHINEVRQHKKELEDQKKSMGEVVKFPQLNELKQNFERRLEAGDARFRSIEQSQQLKIDAIREEFRAESVEMRKEMNGLGDRLTRQGEASENRLAKQIEVMGDGFEKQMAMIVKHSEQLNNVMLELQRALAASQASGTNT